MGYVCLRTNWLKRRGPEKPFETTFRDHGVPAVLSAMVGIAPEPGVVREVCDEIGQVDGNESPRDCESAKAPLLVHRLEALKESEYEGIGETGEQRQTQDNGLGDQHDPGTHPDGAELLEGNARGLQFVGAVDVGVLASLAPALGLLVEDDRCARFGHEEVDGLGAAVEHELDPEVPAPVEESFNGTTNDTTDTCANARRQDDESKRELLVLRLVEIGDQTKRNTATSG